MPNGYMGKILWVDLSDESFKEEKISDEIYRQYLGGYGLAAKLIYENMPKKSNPLGPDAILAFFPGLLTGSTAPLTGRYMVAGKSPLTGTWGDSHCGGFFGPEIKKCGYDGILIKGIAKSPKIISIINDKKEIIDATAYWGLDTVEIEDKLNQEFKGARIASIGPAGENLSLIAGIVNDKGRIAARSGLGAVMGSKKLKALVLKGNKEIPFADKEFMTELTKEYNKGIREADAGSIQLWRDIGTPWMNDIVTKTGDTPIKNWGGVAAEHYPDEKLDNILGSEFEKYKERKFGCFACPVACGALLKVPDLNIDETHRPEYETCASFGQLLLNDDLDSIIKINDMCNRAGMDTISAGGTLAFAVECFENGILGLDDTEGLKLKWGDAENYIKIMDKMINREGIGDVLADGSKIASEKIQRGSEQYAIHSLGQELAMHSPKYYKSLGMSYAFDPTPGRHTSGTLDMMIGGPMLKANGLFEGFALPKKFKRPGEGRNEALQVCSCLWQATSCMGLCQFAYFFQKYPLLELIKAVVGWEMDFEEILAIGKRIQTLREAFTLREGIDIADNEIPKRSVGVNYKADYESYCEHIGWNPETGKPLEKTLNDLNLDFVIKDFY
ncbi:MAG: aldehyde ferredoxin oxidoreductase [Promethearchaeota archaeon]|nr:MAG: aldehyde ferredoxin oxidoreductase [Candidatus Lokiarchaeota archaeon]